MHFKTVIMTHRIEKDTMGSVKVPNDKYWGAQTERATKNFNIGKYTIPQEIISALADTKKAAAYANCDLAVLSQEKRDLIATVCDEITNGDLTEHFPLTIWETGSGTQSNMNMNEVIANRGEVVRGGVLNGEKTFLSPNDDVNLSQSTNDVFPTAVRVAVTKVIKNHTLPSLNLCLETLEKKVEEFKDIIKVGRTHLRDATPMTLGQEFATFHSQITYGVQALKRSLPHLTELPLGGTAIGTGLTAPKNFDSLAVQYLNQFTEENFTVSKHKFEAIASHDAMVEVSGALKQIAVSLAKMSNDIRLLSSGPRGGINELIIPANEPGSSIMPGKVNPTQCEALSIVCCQIIGNDSTISLGAMQGHLQLNVFMPLIGNCLLESAQLMGDIARNFTLRCLAGLTANREQIEKNLENSLMLVTALNPHIGYYKAAKIAQYAFDKNISLKEAAKKLKILTEDEFNRFVVPKKMV